jgi:hypothetical protein
VSSPVALFTSVATKILAAFPSCIAALSGMGPTVSDALRVATRASTGPPQTHDAVGRAVASQSTDGPLTPPVHPLQPPPPVGPPVPVGPAAGASVSGSSSGAGQSDDSGDYLAVLDADLATSLAHTAARVAFGVAAEVRRETEPGHRPG